MSNYSHLKDITIGNDGFCVKLRVHFEFDENLSKTILNEFELELIKFEGKKEVSKELMYLFFDTYFTLYSMIGVIKNDDKMDDKIMNLIIDLNDLKEKYLI